MIDGWGGGRERMKERYREREFMRLTQNQSHADLYHGIPETLRNSQCIGLEGRVQYEA